MLVGCWVNCEYCEESTSVFTVNLNYCLIFFIFYSLAVHLVNQFSYTSNFKQEKGESGFNGFNVSVEVCR